MNNPIRRMSLLVAALFCTLFIATSWIQFVQAGELRERPGNRRTLLASYAQERGAILVGGEAVARSACSLSPFSSWLFPPAVSHSAS